jgi:hypothetical protein
MASIDLKDLSEQQKQLLTGLLSQLTDPAAPAKPKKPRNAETVTASHGTSDCRIGDLRFPECQL